MPLVSIGDVFVCTQLAFRLYTTLTSGRKNAPRDMKALGDILFSLYCALSYLERQLEIILSGPLPDRNERDIVHPRRQLGRMINSCLKVLQELDEATASYRQAALEPPHATSSPYYRVFGMGFSQQLKAQVKVQWLRVQWYLRSDSFTKYRIELQSHTSAINLLLSSMTWSSTTHFQEIGRRQTQRLEEIEQTTVLLNENMDRLVQAITSPRTHRPTLILPSLILPIGDPQVAYFSTAALDQVLDASHLAVAQSFPDEQNWLSSDSPVWPIIPRIQRQSNRQLSNVAPRVAEGSEPA